MRILMVEDNPGRRQAAAGDIWWEIVASAEVFHVVHVERLVLALQSLDEGAFEVVLLDLSLPDSQGIETLTKVRTAKPGMPIVVLSSLDDELLGLQLLQRGAQDYLVKGEVTASLLRRSLRYAVERKRAEVELRTSEVFLESIVENIPHMIFVKDASELRFVRFNKAGEELLGHTRQNLIGKSDYELFPKEEADFFTGADRDVLRNREGARYPGRTHPHQGERPAVPSYEKNSNSRRKRPAALLARNLRRHH